jgi:hypothetical protein
MADSHQQGARRSAIREHQVGGACRNGARPMSRWRRRCSAS